MGNQLYNNEPRNSDVEMTAIDLECAVQTEDLQVKTLQAEIIQARQKLTESEAIMIEMQRKLDDYFAQERQIAEVMIAAQISAQKTEASARARAEVIIQETEETLRMKQRELELLQMRAQSYKEDIVGRLEQYKSSVEKVNIMVDDSAFPPAVVSEETKADQRMIG
ncbi:MAG: hypothetical protein GX133_05775 [Syntrophomonadaceae bacterium]|nr:hypothetical protein [Syntrophomonadaceae bacterium]